MSERQVKSEKSILDIPRWQRQFDSKPGFGRRMNGHTARTAACQDPQLICHLTKEEARTNVGRDVPAGSRPSGRRAAAAAPPSPVGPTSTPPGRRARWRESARALPASRRSPCTQTSSLPPARRTAGPPELNRTPLPGRPCSGLVYVLLYRRLALRAS